MQDKKALVIPDIHGRTFWKEAKDFGGQIVFLGDYHDPYMEDFLREGEIFPLVRDYHRESIDNMLEIFQFASDNRDRVTLLMGNHDMAYLYPDDCMPSRFDSYNAEELFEIFAAKRCLLNGCKRIGRTLFSHAGVSRQWYDAAVGCNPSLDPEYVEENINEAICSPWEDVFMISELRGGDDNYSSPLWMDFHELQPGYVSILRPDYQIFGHTQQEETGAIVRDQGWACIDSRCIFEVDCDNPEKTLKPWARV